METDAILELQKLVARLELIEGMKRMPDHLRTLATLDEYKFNSTVSVLDKISDISSAVRQDMLLEAQQ